MRTLVLVLLALAIVVPAAPSASAHHVTCTPEHPCSEPAPPCDRKCWTMHLAWMAQCIFDPASC